MCLCSVYICVVCRYTVCGCERHEDVWGKAINVRCDEDECV